MLVSGGRLHMVARQSVGSVSRFRQCQRDDVDQQFNRRTIVV